MQVVFIHAYAKNNTLAGGRAPVRRALILHYLRLGASFRGVTQRVRNPGLEQGGEVIE